MAAILDLAEEVLKKASVPLSYMEIWEAAKAGGLPDRMGLRGRTPWNTISSALSADVKKSSSLFCVISERPQRFFLKAREGELAPEIIEKLRVQEFVEDEESPPSAAPRFREEVLHPLLAHFVYDSRAFWGERQIYTKTINHTKSARGLNEWLHPDMVGVYLPFGDLNQRVINFNKKIGQDSLARFYSFELKRELTKRNYRESYFQAVSNSSWANEGYLVAADISEDEALQRELERLVNAFGIGVICLYPSDFYASEVLFPSKTRPFLDWDTFNKLHEANEDFSGFIENVKRDFDGSAIYPEYYDEILEDPTVYIKDKMKIEQVDAI